MRWRENQHLCVGRPCAKGRGGSTGTGDTQKMVQMRKTRQGPMPLSHTAGLQVIFLIARKWIIHRPYGRHTVGA